MSECEETKAQVNRIKYVWKVCLWENTSVDIGRVFQHLDTHMGPTANMLKTYSRRCTNCSGLQLSYKQYGNDKIEEVPSQSDTEVS